MNGGWFDDDILEAHPNLKKHLDLYRDQVQEAVMPMMEEEEEGPDMPSSMMEILEVIQDLYNKRKGRRNMNFEEFRRYNN